MKKYHVQNFRLELFISILQLSIVQVSDTVGNGQDKEYSIEMDEFQLRIEEIKKNVVSYKYQEKQKIEEFNGLVSQLGSMVNKDQSVVEAIKEDNQNLLKHQDTLSFNDQVFHKCEKCWNIAQEEKKAMNISGKTYFIFKEIMTILNE